MTETFSTDTTAFHVSYVYKWLVILVNKSFFTKYDKWMGMLMTQTLCNSNPGMLAWEFQTAEWNCWARLNEPRDGRIHVR